MNFSTSDVERVFQAIDTQRLIDLAVQLIEIPSPTRSAGAVADKLAAVLSAAGFAVQRVAAGWPEAPAVVAQFDTGRPGRTLQFNGHLDTVHLPFVAPRIENGILFGSGSADMKGGIAAMAEALRALRDSGTLRAGKVLLTAHDLHETPWGDGSQVDGLIDAGHLGDGVLLPEYLCDRLPIIGRGLAVLGVTIRRDGSPVHEVLGGLEQPSVIAAGAELVARLEALDRSLAQRSHELAGRESLFVGQVSSGEIYNQAPVEFRLAGTRRWLPGTSIAEVQAQFRAVLEEVARSRSVQVGGTFQVARDAFELLPGALRGAFQAAHKSVVGRELPLGAKPFVDDGNTFASRGRIPAITHGPHAKGAHTLQEEVPIAELVRVARVYALTALEFCPTAG
jgi:acetylornithine deacetylase/succinyl-diaminopimelate desuccinylase-like protein